MGKKQRKERAPSVSKVGRLWKSLGRLLSPISASALFVFGLIIRNKELRSSARDILAGRKSLVGPGVSVPISGGSHIRQGVFSERELSERMNLELDGDELDRNYLSQIGPRKDLALLLRGLWAYALDKNSKSEGKGSNDHFNLFGVIVNNSETPRMLQTLDNIIVSHPNLLLKMLPDGPCEPSRPAHVCFVNANNFNLALEKSPYMKAIRSADLVLPDGIGVKIALQMAGGRLQKNLNGTDLLPHLAELLVRNDWPIFLLGASDTVLETAQANLLKRHPKIKIAAVHNGYFTPEDEADLCRSINDSGAVALIIGMGTPRQELFVARNASRLEVPVILSMGGLIDFLGEKNKRAPMWMRQAGLEWVYRLLQEPGRMWKRYIIGNPVFLWRVRRWIRSHPASNQSARSRT